MVATVAVIDDDCFSVQECVQAISCGSSIEETMYIGSRSVNVHTLLFLYTVSARAQAIRSGLSKRLRPSMEVEAWEFRSRVAIRRPNNVPLHIRWSQRSRSNLLFA